MRSNFIFVLAAFFVALGYVVWHLWRITPSGWWAKLTVAALFLAWMVLAFAGFSQTEKLPLGLAAVIYETGLPWMIAFLYLLILFLVADAAVLCRFLPKSYLTSSGAGLAAAVGIVAVVMVLGNVHYHHKYRTELSLQTDKPLERPLTVVLASDLHLGYHNRRGELARWIDMVNAENPDFVLIGGDIVDRSLRPLEAWDYGTEFRRLTAPVYTVLGNHDYYSNEEGAERFFTEAGITLLRDSSVEIDGVRIIGRDDRTNRGRLPVSALVGEGDMFTILLDHQPYGLEEAEQAGIDFQFSGHTHRGQVWPVSWVTDRMYEKAWGEHVRGATRYYISSGLGIWGPKIRIGTRSEYIVLKVAN